MQATIHITPTQRAAILPYARNYRHASDMVSLRSGQLTVDQFKQWELARERNLYAIACEMHFLGLRKDGKLSSPQWARCIEIVQTVLASEERTNT